VLLHNHYICVYVCVCVCVRARLCLLKDISVVHKLCVSIRAFPCTTTWYFVQLRSQNPTDVLYRLGKDRWLIGWSRILQCAWVLNFRDIDSNDNFQRLKFIIFLRTSNDGVLEVEILVHSFLTSALYGCEFWASHPAAFFPKKGRVHMEQRADTVPKPAWAFLKMMNSLVPSRFPISGLP